MNIKKYALGPKTLTIGYNLDGQRFFNMAAHYKTYIEEFYFSLKHTMRNTPLDEDKVLHSLNKCHTYGIPGNLLLNRRSENEDWKRLIKKAMDATQIHSVSVLSYDTAKKVKKRFPELRIHISTEGAYDLNPKNMSSEILYCVNLEEPMIKDHHMQDIFKRCMELGIKTKFIVNRGCVICRHHMLRKLFNDASISCCNGTCYKLAQKDYAWLNLCRIDYCKEMMLYWKPDFLKITSREISTENLKSIIKEWITPSYTKELYGVDVTKHYDTFLDWIRIRMTECNGHCYECFKCKDIYDRLIEQ